MLRALRAEFSPNSAAVAKDRIRELARKIRRRRTRHEADSDTGMGLAETADTGPLGVAVGHEQDEVAAAAVRIVARGIGV